MRVLALESSCDETAAALVEATPDERAPSGARFALRGASIATQFEVHQPFGGVVPELASRQHLLNLVPVLDETLRQAGATMDHVDAVAVTCGPGLVGALLCALQFGKALAFARGLPVWGVNHLEGHLLASCLEDDPPPFPHLGLLVSGGHSMLVRIERPGGPYQILGNTRDDAAGEAFDKGGKLMNLGYPAGPVIDRLARDGDPRAVPFPKAMTGEKRALDMSFSGLKTALANHLTKLPAPPEGAALADLCASYQAAIIEQLQRKAALALTQTGLPALVLSGGVAANSGLRAALAELCQQRGVRFHGTAPRFCTDNAAMIAVAGYFPLAAGRRAPLTLSVNARLPLGAPPEERPPQG